MEHKNSVIRTLVHRANTLCDEDAKLAEMNHVKKVLQQNDYPIHQITKIAHRTQQARTNQVTHQDTNLKYVSIPYIQGTSERIGRILKKHSIRVAHKPSVTLKSKLCQIKDKREVSERAGVVYQINCNNCPAKYIGETGR